MFIFESVSERDIDLIVMRAFVEFKGFADLFFDCIGCLDANVVSVEHSRTDPKWGETDIAVIYEKDNKRHALLIENKIDAGAMDQQYNRYVKRGDKDVDNGIYVNYDVFIIAPQNYLDNNAEAQLYPNKLSYETLLEFFKQNDSVFERDMIISAIKKEEKGYIVSEVPTITEFWNKLYAYVEKSDYKVKMKKPRGAKGAFSLWTYFDVPLTGTLLVFKSEKGYVDLEFSGKRTEGLAIKTYINEYKDEDMHWADTGNSISLRLEVKAIDFTMPFEIYIEEINVMLSAMERLRSLAVTLNDIGYIV